MTEEETRAVSVALARMGAAQRAAISAFTTPEQLHQFALGFNANDDPLVCLAVVEHELCDHGTALFMFWRFEDLILFSDRAADAAQVGNQSAKQALAGIRHILETRTFRSASIAYSAFDDLQLNALQRRKLASLALPDRMLKCPGE
jgi:hypothetical protein